MSHPEDTTPHMVPLLPVEVTGVVLTDERLTRRPVSMVPQLQLRQLISQTNAVLIAL
jgi:hypothetical protein